jgi:hypothetical protein
MAGCYRLDLFAHVEKKTTGAAVIFSGVYFHRKKVARENPCPPGRTQIFK